MRPNRDMEKEKQHFQMVIHMKGLIKMEKDMVKDCTLGNQEKFMR